MIRLLSFTFMILLIPGLMLAQEESIPAHWAQITVTDTVHVPLPLYYGLAEEVDFEQLTAAARQKGTPNVVDGEAINGDFTAAGHSRWLIFDNGKRMKETILHKDQNLFLMELTDIELGLRRMAHRSRVQFDYQELGEDAMTVTWTYSFEQKNGLTKRMLSRFLEKQHQFWMAAFLGEMKRQVEEIHASESITVQP